MGKTKQEDNVEDRSGQPAELAQKSEQQTQEQKISELQMPEQQMPIAAKRIAAAIGIFLLLALVVATFVVACVDFNGKDQVFAALLLCDIVIPVFLWFILRFLR